VVRNWWDIMRRQKRLTWFTAGYGQAAVIFPILVAAPRYFRGEIPLGALMQTSQAFGQVQDALSFIVTSYTDIAEWRAVVLRLLGFERALARVRAEAAVEGVHHGTGGADSLTLDRVNLTLPGGRPLMEDVSFDIRPGVTALISGPSGAGKSTLFRAIAGIWPFGRGDVRLPRDARVLFLPQKPYLPIGTLREVVSYPTPLTGVSDAALRQALEAVGLPELAGRLDETTHWALALSPGEQQRIAFARALVQRPEWLFLDEATSALDEETEARLYALLRDQLPATTVVSVGHRSTLRAFHARRLVVTPNGTGAATVAEVAAQS
jgi:putative ATP-binding cassette transporter